MQCPKCSAELSDAELLKPSFRELAMAILLDWRVWLGAVLTMALAGLVTGAIGRPSAGGAAGGAVIGVLVALRMARLRRCARCGGTIAVIPPSAS